MKKLLIFICFLFLACSKERPLIKVAVDSSWRDVELYGQSKNVNGFLEDFLLEACKEEKIKIDYIKVNSFQLLDGLQAGKFDAVLSVLYPYDFNLAKYAFSPLVLLTGSVLVVRKEEELKNFSDRLLGVITEDDTNFLMQKHPEAIYKEYFSAPELLDALQEGFLDGGILESLEAKPYVHNLYPGLKVQKPLSNFGIRFISLKQKEKTLDVFKELLEDTQKMHRLKAKWGLVY